MLNTPAHQTSAYLNSVETIQVARSFLFVPGDRPERFDKASAAGADVVIIDLEDAVAPPAKSKARESTKRWLREGGRALVRVNAESSPYYAEDLVALVDADGLVGVVLAKAESPETAQAVADAVACPVVALVESAVGMLHAVQLAAAPGVARLAFGHLDYAVDIDAEPSWDAMLHGRSTLVLASRAAGLPGPIDGVTTAIDNVAALNEDLLRGREIGLTAKLLIHPRQVAPVHDAYRPDAATVQWAERVVEAASDGAAVQVDGQMVDAPVLARARSVLRWC
jgi:citrate lyase subunit beta / citryl-CoA lyase